MRQKIAAHKGCRTQEHRPPDRTTHSTQSSARRSRPRTAPADHHRAPHRPRNVAGAVPPAHVCRGKAEVAAPLVARAAPPSIRCQCRRMRAALLGGRPSPKAARIAGGRIVTVGVEMSGSPSPRPARPATPPTNPIPRLPRQLEAVCHDARDLSARQTSRTNVRQPQLEGLHQGELIELFNAELRAGCASGASMNWRAAGPGNRCGCGSKAATPDALLRPHRRSLATAKTSRCPRRCQPQLPLTSTPFNAPAESPAHRRIVPFLPGPRPRLASVELVARRENQRLALEHDRSPRRRTLRAAGHDRSP